MINRIIESIDSITRTASLMYADLKQLEYAAGFSGPRMKKYRPITESEKRGLAKSIAKRRKKNKNKKSHRK